MDQVETKSSKLPSTAATPEVTQSIATEMVPLPASNESKQNENKIKVHFVPVGNAPIMKRTKFGVNVDDGKHFASLNAFLRKMLKLKSDQSLFLYINSAFVPSPDENLKDLNDCFSIRGELVVNYALQEAWG